MALSATIDLTKTRLQINEVRNKGTDHRSPTSGDEVR